MAVAASVRWPVRVSQQCPAQWELTVFSSYIITVITASPRSPLFSFTCEAFEKISHLYQEKVLITTKLTALIVQIRKRKPKYLQKFMTYVFGLGGFPPFLNCLFAKQHQRHIVSAGKVGSWAHCAISELDLCYLSSTFHSFLGSCSSLM